jgi:hypothetical protein
MGLRFAAKLHEERQFKKRACLEPRGIPTSGSGVCSSKQHAHSRKGNGSAAQQAPKTVFH